jgi:hypothetical protein
VLSVIGTVTKKKHRDDHKRCGQPRTRGRKPNRTLRKFTVLLDLLMGSRNYTAKELLKACDIEPTFNLCSVINWWRSGLSGPRRGKSLSLLETIERHFELPDGRLSNLLRRGSSAIFQDIRMRYRSMHYIISWHIPADFDSRTEADRQQILDWLRANVLPANTEYGKYLRDAAHFKHALVFPTLPRSLGGHKLKQTPSGRSRSVQKAMIARNPRAPDHIVKEIVDLAKHNTAPLPPPGYFRRGMWRHPTMRSDIRRCGSVLGLLAAPPEAKVGGRGVPFDKLTLGLFVFPALWDWYLQWNLARRGFFTNSEQLALHTVKVLTRARTGWLRQHPELARKLEPIDELITARDIQKAQKDWGATCDAAYEFARERKTELNFAVRHHRDPSLPILPVLSSPNPMREYKKIGDEILRWMPNEVQSPVQMSSHVRDYLIFRFAIHLGIRSRNLRELLLCPPTKPHSSMRSLEKLRQGELRWKSEDRAWEVIIPSVAFKNGQSSFFCGRPFHMTLPDLEGLYGWIKRYIEIDRLRLLDTHSDPHTFFVRAYRENIHPSYDEHSFSKLWSTFIQRYGIYNPYTGRGAIEGLLCHGHHAVRSVLATHLIKKTGSYELASYAIQDTVKTVMKRYGRFLPHEKLARVADELNKVWR